MAVMAVIPHFFPKDPLFSLSRAFCCLAQMIIRKRKKYEITATTAPAPAVDLRDGEGCHVAVLPGTGLGAWVWIRRDPSRPARA